MARFYGGIHGDDRNETTRLGHKRITAFAQGWNVGITVDGYIDGDGKDRFDVYVTDGSNAEGRNKQLGSFTREDIENVKEQ